MDGECTSYSTVVFAVETMTTCFSINGLVRISVNNYHLKCCENVLQTYSQRSAGQDAQKNQTSEVNHATPFAEEQGNKLPLYDNIGH